MKKLCCLVLSVLLLAGTLSLFSGCTPRGKKLYIYNWNDYMDEEYVTDKKTGFSKYYKDLTGETVKVEFVYFDGNEDMYDRVKNQASDYELICPSDYMNERMQYEGLLEKIDTEIVYGDKTPEDLFLPEMLEIVSELDSLEHGKWTDYAVPYMWGTLGLMYNYKYVEENKLDENDMTSWASLFDESLIGSEGKYKNHFTMKDSERDAFAAANIWLNKDELSTLSSGFTDYTTNPEYAAKLNEFVSPAAAKAIAEIDKAAVLLKTQKSGVKNYEVDGGKNDLIIAANDVYYGLFWSCDAGYAMVENQNLYYEVPKEGSNVWFDAFVINKNGVNKTAAQYFLKYLLEERVSLATVQYVGASTPVIKTTEAFKDYLNEDEDGFFLDKNGDVREDFKDMYFRMMFPDYDPDLLPRCAMMRDFGAAGAAHLAQKWQNDIKTA